MSDKHDKKRSKRSSKTKSRQRDDEREDAAGGSDGPGREDGVGKDGSGSGSDGGLSRSNKNTNKKKSKRSKKDKKHKDKGSARGSGSTGDDDDDAEDKSSSPSAGKGGSKSSRRRSHKDWGKGSGKRSGMRRGLASEDSDDDGKAEEEDKKEGADAAAKKLADNVNLVKDAKETFAELQARRAVNLARCRLALCLSTLLGVVLVVVGAGLLIAFGFVGRCADADFPYSCGSFECCATSCNATATIVGDEADAATEESDNTNNNCELVIANPVEISGIVLLLVGWIAIVAALVCFVQVNRVARLDVPASVFGYTLVVSLVLIVLAVIGFIIAALPGSSAGSAAGTTTLQESFLVFALTAVWPGIVLLVVALVGLYTAWKSQATSRKKKILVLGLNGSGKSHVASGIATAAQSGRQRRSGGSVQNMGGRSTSGVFVQGVTRSDGYALELLETGDMALARAVTNTAVQGVNALVFVVDTCDKARLQDAGVFLEQVYALPDFWGLPLLVVGNKSGRWDAVTAQSLVNALNLHVVRDRHWYFVSCSATRGSSKSFRDALEWLCEELEIPVELQVQHPNFIASAFPCVPSESTQGNGEGRARPPPAQVQGAAGVVGSSAAEGKTGRAEAKSSSSETKLAEAV